MANITAEQDTERKGIIDILVERNGYHYNLHKSSEELQELSLILTQKLLKPNKVKEQAIIDEIGDVIIRLEILQKIFDKEKVEKRIAYKLGKFHEYVDHNSYKHI